MTYALPRVRVAAIALGIAAAALIATATLPKTTSIPSATAASADYYLKIEGVDGESAATNHKGEIDIQSFSWGVSNAGSMASGTGGGAGKASFSDLSIMKRVDKSSTALFESCATGKHFPKAVLTARTGATLQGRPTTDDNFRITLEDVTCSSLQDSGSSSDYPAESFSLNYTKIQYEYKPQGSSEWMKASWDLAKGTKI